MMKWRPRQICNFRAFSKHLGAYTCGLAGFVFIGVFSLPPKPAAASDATRLVSMEARRQGVPVTFALKMAKIESGVQCGRRNARSTASGPLQVLKGTARALGYRGDIRRASCATQTHYGVKHLAMCYRGARGNQALAKRCHQVGVSVLYGKKSKKRRR